MRPYTLIGSTLLFAAAALIILDRRLTDVDLREYVEALEDDLAASQISAHRLSQALTRAEQTLQVQHDALTAAQTLREPCCVLVQPAGYTYGPFTALEATRFIQGYKMGRPGETLHLLGNHTPMGGTA